MWLATSLAQRIPCLSAYAFRSCSTSGMPPRPVHTSAVIARSSGAVPQTRGPRTSDHWCSGRTPLIRRPSMLCRMRRKSSPQTSSALASGLRSTPPHVLRPPAGPPPPRGEAGPTPSVPPQEGGCRAAVRASLPKVEDGCPGVPCRAAALLSVAEARPSSPLAGSARCRPTASPSAGTAAGRPRGVTPRASKSASVSQSSGPPRGLGAAAGRRSHKGQLSIPSHLPWAQRQPQPLVHRTLSPWSQKTRIRRETRHVPSVPLRQLGHSWCPLSVSSR